MKKTTILILAVLLTATFNYSSGKSTGGPGSLVITTLIINANVNVVLVDNDKVAVEMTGRHSFTRFVTLTQSGDTLVIGSTRDRDFKGEGIVYVPSSQLRKIRINSDAHIRSLDVLQIPVLDVVINGACDFTVLNIGELKVTGTDQYSFDEDSKMRPVPSSLRRKQ